MRKLLLLLLVVSFIGCNTDKVNQEAETDVIITKPQENINDSSELLSYNSDRTKLKWTAYKTPEKVAVHGTFDSIVVSNTTESMFPEEVLENASFKIYTSSMTTGDASRDGKIIGLFFNNLADNVIHGSFGKFDDETVAVDIVMNDQLAKKNFKYTLENKKLIITGVVDILEDFKAQKGFDILHEACSALHLDKTWTDVSIEIITNLDKTAE